MTLILAFGAAPQTTGQTTGQTGATSSDQLAQQVLSDADYVVRAATGDLFDVAASRLALQLSQDPAILQFAQTMIDDDSRMLDALEDAVAMTGLDIPVPKAPTAAAAQNLAALRAAGAGFDSLYVGQQLEAQETALSLHAAYAEAGADPELRAVAMTAVPVVTSHLEQIRAIAAAATDASQ